MIRPGGGEALSGQALSGQQYATMGNYILMPQAAMAGGAIPGQGASSAQFRHLGQTQMGQYQLGQMGQQQILLPQGLAGQFPMQFPFLQSESNFLKNLLVFFTVTLFFDFTVEIKR